MVIDTISWYDIMKMGVLVRKPLLLLLIGRRERRALFNVM